MSESLGKAVLELAADLNPLKKDLAKAKGESEEMARSTAASFKNGIQKAAIPAAAALGVVAIGLKKSVDAAADAQRVQVKLEQAMKNAGLSYADYADQINNAITKTSELSGLDDEDLAESFSNMIRTTKDVNKALELNALAADLARTKGMDLAAAQSLLARVYNGSFTGLKRLGVAITPVTTAQDKLKASSDHATDAQKRAAKQADFVATRQKAIALLQKDFGGQAEAYGKTAAGAQDRMRVATENLEEALGAGLLPIVTALSGTLADGVEWMTRHSTIAKIAIGIVVGLAAAVLAVNVGMKLYTAGAALATAAQWLWNAALSANPIGLVILAIAALVAIAVVVVRHWGAVSAFFGRLWGGIKGAFSSAIDWIQSKMIAFVNFLIDKLNWLIDKYNLVAGWLTGNIGAVGHVGKSGQPSVPGVRGAAAGFGGLGGPVGHAAGGIFTRPHLAMIAERGPEAVIPLTGGGNPGIGGGTVNVYVSGVVGNERDVAVKIGRELENLKLRGLSFNLG